MESKTDLLEIVLTLRFASGFPRRLHGRQQQCNENGNDGDHDKQFNQREREACG